MQLIIYNVTSTLQNFLYFYFYEWLKGVARRCGVKQSTLANAMMGTLAGTANLTLTLPLETVIVRLQTAAPTGAPSFKPELCDAPGAV